MTLNSEAERHLREFEQFLRANKKSAYTVKGYGIYARLFLQWLGKNPRKATASDLEAYKRHLSLDRKYAKTTLYVTVRALHSFFKFLNMDISEKFLPPRRGEPIPKYLSEDETSALIASSSGNPRDQAIILSLAYTGVRVGELCALDIDDVDFSDNIVTVRSGKGEKGRIVLMEEKTSDALRKYLDSRDASFGPLFLSDSGSRIRERAVQKIVKKYSIDCGITKKVTPHVLRHTLATTLLRKGADIRIIQQLLGHASVATTQIYTHVDDRALKDAYRRAKPGY